MIMVIPILILAATFASPTPAGPTEKKPPSPTPAKPAQPVPSLDEALGLAAPKATPKDTVDPATRESLDRALSGEEEGDDFKQAVALMSQCAEQLGSKPDTGAATQRMQEDAIRKLEALLKKAQQKKQCSNPNNQCDNPSDQQKQDQQKPQQDQSQPSQSNQSQQNQQSQAQKSDGNKDTGQVARRDGDLRPTLDAARAAWGNLPDRVRQMLMQGAGDAFSKDYQKLTEEYYKRLGEQGEKK